MREMLCWRMYGVQRVKSKCLLAMRHWKGLFARHFPKLRSLHQMQLLYWLDFSGKCFRVHLLQITVQTAVIRRNSSFRGSNNIVWHSDIIRLFHDNSGHWIVRGSAVSLNRFDDELKSASLFEPHNEVVLLQRIQCAKWITKWISRLREYSANRLFAFFPVQCECDVFLVVDSVRNNDASH